MTPFVASMAAFTDFHSLVKPIVTYFFKEIFPADLRNANDVEIGSSGWSLF